jgi:uncharacterized protein (TIGR03118 family)
MAQYQLTNLVSNQVGSGRHTDPLIVNAWGLAYGPGGAFWLSDTGSGWSTLYNGQGVKESLQVVVPSASGAGPGSPTGIVFNGSSDFQVGGWNAFFLFATLDGTISGWAPETNPNSALIQVTKPGTVYTGLAITNKPSGNFLYAADNAGNKVDVYDGTFNLVNSFTDSTLPPGFAPFGIQDIGGLLYVAFGAFGQPGGFIDIFQEDGKFVRQLASGKPLSNPWGFAVAPKNFGKLSNTLLVSNNTKNGTINAFNPVTGQYVGTVKDASGKNIVIQDLWGIEFGGGTPANGRTNQLFFTAGPHGYLAGTFGVVNLK